MCRVWIAHQTHPAFWERQCLRLDLRRCPCAPTEWARSIAVTSIELHAQTLRTVLGLPSSSARSSVGGLLSQLEISTPCRFRAKAPSQLPGSDPVRLIHYWSKLSYKCATRPVHDPACLFRGPRPHVAWQPFSTSGQCPWMPVPTPAASQTRNAPGSVFALTRQRGCVKVDTRAPWIWCRQASSVDDSEWTSSVSFSTRRQRVAHGGD